MDVGYIFIQTIPPGSLMQVSGEELVHLARDMPGEDATEEDALSFASNWERIPPELRGYYLLFTG